MEYETVTYYDDERASEEIVEVHRYQEDLVVWNPTLDPQSTGAPITTRVITRRNTGMRRTRRPVIEKSSRQDTLTPGNNQGRVPKTRGDTNEFISAFWVKGKPKSRKGYTYDFRRKMCRRIQ